MRQAAGSGLKAVALIRREPQRVGEAPQRAALGPMLTGFEPGDTPHGQPSPFGECFLRQPRAEAIVAQECAEYIRFRSMSHRDRGPLQLSAFAHAFCSFAWCAVQSKSNLGRV